MSLSSSAIDSTNMGCELPEHLRLYYLDAMEIVCWQEQGGSPAAPIENDVTVKQSAPVTKETEPVTTPASDAEQWLALEQAVSSCEKCEALCQSRTKTVFGIGDRQADILVIGEAPNSEEDELGEPFAGKAGQLLVAMLKAISLDKQNVFICNILHCRPADDRDPSTEEMANCSDYLRQKISLMQPKAILVFGRLAAQHLLQTKTAIGKLRGEQYSYDGIPLFVTYHPAYLLRKPSEKRKAWQDLLQLQALMTSWR